MGPGGPLGLHSCIQGFFFIGLACILVFLKFIRRRPGTPRFNITLLDFIRINFPELLFEKFYKEMKELALGD